MDSAVSSEPCFAEFPRSEYEDRVSRAQTAMQERGIDALLLTGKENLRYFAGGPLTELTIDCYNTFFLLLPADPSKATALLMSCGREGPASTSWVAARRFWGYGDTGSIMEQSQSLSMVAEVVADRGLGEGVIGTELDRGLRIGMTLTEFEELKAMLPNARFCSAADVVWSVREIKSAREIERVRQACTITCDAFATALRQLQPGMSERDLASIIRARMFELGATDAGFLAVYGGASRGMWADAMPSDNELKRGDLVMLDGGCGVDGYLADVSRMACIGEPTAETRRLYELTREAQASALAAVRAGTTMRELHEAGQAPFRHGGATDLLVFGAGQLGHGIGLTIHEPPDVSAASEAPLEAGMTIAVEPAITNRSGWHNSSYFVIVENNVVVTDQGYDLLTPLSDELWIV